MATQDRKWMSSLAPKLLAAVAGVVVLVVVVLSAFAIQRQTASLEAEFASKGEAIALSLAAGMEQTVGSSISTVQGAIDSNKVIKGVCYIYIQDSDRSVLVHTFSPSFPAGFEKLNSVSDETEFSSAQKDQVAPVDFADAECTSAAKKRTSAGAMAGVRAIDVAVPISGGALGYVHVGMDRDDIRAEVRSLTLGMAGIGILLGLGGIAAAGWFVIRLVVQPVRELTRVTGQIVSRGDLSQPINVQSNDEIGALADTFREMVQKLRSIPATLSESVKQLGRAVDGLTEVTRQQTGIVQRQASGLSEASATTQEIKQTSAVAATKAEAVSQIAVKAEEYSLAGQGAVEASISGIQDIRAQVEAIVGKIADLSERTLQVSEIIESVKDLADQSNVLALNAAIEAAKAGEFGKGFGVVAREIRSLADQSIQSTGRIREILSEIQGAIRGTVAITEEGKRKMEQSMDEIRSSGESLRELTSIVRESSQAARQIAASVNQQNAGISQISLAIQNLNLAMEETTVGIRSSETAAENLKSISGTISGIVEAFKV